MRSFCFSLYTVAMAVSALERETLLFSLFLSLSRFGDKRVEMKEGKDGFVWFWLGR